MSSSQREPLSIEFSESTELEKYLPHHELINQTNLPASFVIEDDLHQSQITTTQDLDTHQTCLLDSQVDMPGNEAAKNCDHIQTLLCDEGIPEVLSRMAKDKTNRTILSPSLLIDADSGLKLSLESDDLGDSVSNKIIQDPVLTSSKETADKYVFPTFPEVPDIQDTLSSLAYSKEAERGRHLVPENGSTDDRAMSVARKGYARCHRHATLERDEFDNLYCKALASRHQRTQQVEEPSLCSSCSESMMQYVSTIQKLLQQLMVDIIVKGKDAPACSWCAREKRDAVQDRWTSRAFPAPSFPDESSKSNVGAANSQQNGQLHSYHTAIPEVPLSFPASPEVSLSLRNKGQVAGRPQMAEGLNLERDQSLGELNDVAPIHQVQTFPWEEPASGHNLSDSPEHLKGFDRMNTSLISLVEQRPSQSPQRVNSELQDMERAISIGPNNVTTGQHENRNLTSHLSESGDLHDDSVKRPSELQLYDMDQGPVPSYYSNKKGQSSDAQNGAGRKKSLSSDWMTDLVQKVIPEPLEPTVRNQAYTTMANSDMSAMLCLVLGNSLRLSGTARFLVVLVTDGVSPAFRHLLSCVFNVVQSVRSLGTHGTTKLALLEQPDIGVSFTKLHAWRMTGFSKCVFLDAGTLVVQNCDELFDRDELSAVPDTGWPDCFNSSVFVYVPSMETFWDLIVFAERQGSFDGGDQGLLNAYFRNWSSDINRRLPFIYNLMVNVSYTYKPAFKQFGRNVKVVQFSGGYKPWNVKFHPPTGLLSPAADIHPTYVEFVQFWVQIFVKRVLPLFSLGIQEKTHSHQYTCALDVLQHFPSFLISEPMVGLPTPSFRLHAKPVLYVPLEPRHSPDYITPKLAVTTPQPRMVTLITAASANETQRILEPASTRESSAEQEPKDDVIAPLPGVDENCNIAVVTKDAANGRSEPISVVDDLSGMLAWEQGRADYLGEHRSDNIMAKLDELIGSQETGGAAKMGGAML